jgi:phosphate ABC transporter permease protein PstC
LTALAAAILALIAYFFIRLIGESGNTFSKFGLSFVFGNDWDPSRTIFHGFPLVAGTLITSAIALLLGVPVAVAAALFLNELCPRRFRTPLAILVDLLAAVPSVVYGLWGILVLAPKLLPAEKWFASTFSFIPFVGGGTPTGPNYFLAGLILAIMILPIVSAISREVIATVPREHKEAALALGATRWEMIRIAVLPYSRPGITGAAMLGLGRAIGETIAVVLVIGNAPVIGSHLFNQGYSLAAVIANEFGEAANTPAHSSALFAAGLILFVLTLVVNIIARWFVVRGYRGRRRAADRMVEAQAASVGEVG